VRICESKHLKTWIWERSDGKKRDLLGESRQQRGKMGRAWKFLIGWNSKNEILPSKRF
jgi:hypothetical protein